MAIQIYWGTCLLRDDFGISFEDIKPDSQWPIIREEAYRSPKIYGRGAGNIASTIKFNLVSAHLSYVERLNFALRIGQLMWGTDLTSARELYFLDTSISPVPFSFGVSLPNPPKIVGQGLQDGKFINQFEYEFLVDLLGFGVASSTAVETPAYAPILWLPNAYGVVLRRTSDNAWIRWTRDFTTGEAIFEDLGGDPGSTNYDTTLQDAEWPDSARGFGFYTSTPMYSLNKINNLAELAPETNVSAGHWDTGYTSTKGLIFAAGKGPILRQPNGTRYRMTINELNELAYTLIS